MASRVPTFKEFWQAYPRKRGKDKAEKVWKGMRPEARQLAFAALPAYIDDYQRNNVTFMYPQGWLNQKRWRDYVEEDADAQTTHVAGPQTPCASLKSGKAQGGAGGGGTEREPSRKASGWQTGLPSRAERKPGAAQHPEKGRPDLFDQPADTAAPTLADMETW